MPSLYGTVRHEQKMAEPIRSPALLAFVVEAVSCVGVPVQAGITRLGALER